MKELIKVEDYPGLYRDPVSKAIIVNDPVLKNNFESQKLQRKAISNSLEAVSNLKEEINIMKNEMGEIKDLLRKIVAQTNESK